MQKYILREILCHHYYNLKADSLTSNLFIKLIKELEAYEGYFHSAFSW